MFRATGYAIGGHTYTLDAIEHGLLRANRRPPFALRRTLTDTDPRRASAPSLLDPRIHFALNCGATSCPPIRPYSASGLDTELEAATRAYISAEGEFDGARGRLVLPGLLRLYRRDFEADGGPVAFARRYLPGAESADDVEVDYARFDWTLETSDLSAK